MAVLDLTKVGGMCQEDMRRKRGHVAKAKHDSGRSLGQMPEFLQKKNKPGLVVNHFQIFILFIYIYILFSIFNQGTFRKI